MAYLAHGPGANLPPPMSRVVDDGAVELEDSTLRTIMPLDCSSSTPPQGRVVIAGEGVASSVAISAVAAKQPAAAVYKDLHGKVVASIHEVSAADIVVIAFNPHANFHASWVEQILNAQEAKSE